MRRYLPHSDFYARIVTHLERLIVQYVRLYAQIEIVPIKLYFHHSITQIRAGELEFQLTKNLNNTFVNVQQSTTLIER